MYQCAQLIRSTALCAVALAVITFVGCGGKEKRPAKPPMPVQMSFRPAALSSQGYVLQLKNQSTRHLAVMVLLQNKTVNQQMTGYLTIQPTGLTEFGWLEGWVFLSGETVKLSHEDYQDLEARVP